MIPTWAVIPSAGRSMLHNCLASVRDQVDGIVVVTNSEYDGADTEDVFLYQDRRPDRNISRWWNLGFDTVSLVCDEPEYNVLILNDDVEMHPGSVARLASALRASSAVIASPGHRDVLLTRQGPEDRMAGWCWMLKGETGFRVDESMKWWYSDSDADWRARSLGGTLLVTGVDHVHHDPNGYTNRVPSLMAQTAVDRETFLRRWGRLPH